jgi:ABC-type branched-subunit amino acid transport system ATPase component
MAAGGAVLLVDEPVAGLNDSESEEIAHVIRRLARDRGVAVLVIEHDMSFVMSLCDRVVVMDAGRTVAAGTPEEVRQDRAAIAAYLGEEESDVRNEDAGMLVSSDPGGRTLEDTGPDV